jgi:hypothetical protein
MGALMEEPFTFLLLEKLPTLVFMDLVLLMEEVEVMVKNIHLRQYR